MTWDKPKNAKGWLLLFAPPADLRARDGDGRDW